MIKDSNLYVPANQLNTSDLIGRKKVMNLNSDYAEMVVDYFSYSASNTIGISGFDATIYFQVGDIIKLVQNSIEKFFYVILVESNYIVVNGGDDYSFDSNSITYIAMSRLQNPFGFPGKFGFTPSFIFTSGGTNSLDSGTLEYKMIGNLVLVRGRLYFNLDALFSGVIEGSYPFSLREGISTFEGMNLQPWESPTPDLYNLAFGENANLGSGRELTHFLMSGTYTTLVGSGIPSQMFECNFDYYY